MNSDTNPETQPGVGVLAALAPVAFLTFLLVSAVVLFGDATTGGPAQIALMLSGILAGLIGMRHGIAWTDLESATAISVSRAMPAVFILLMVGALIGVWMLSGTVPFLIFWGLQIIAPEVFYFVSVLICAIIAVSVGSSWTTASTIGVALIGIAAAAGLSVEMTAGAILIALIYFAFASFNAATELEEGRITAISTALSDNYDLSFWALLPALVTIGMAVLRMPAFLALFSGTVVGALVYLAGTSDESMGLAVAEVIWATTANGYEAATGHAELDDLLSRGGMESMLNTIWIALTAMFFGGMMDKSGCLGVMVRYLVMGVKSGSNLMQRAGLTALGTNVIASDQYLAIVLPAQMYREQFKSMELKSRNLSRVLEDYGTTTSPLVPWNSCGAFMAGTLLVSTFAYLPYCVFNIMSPLISFAYAMFNFKVESFDD